MRSALVSLWLFSLVASAADFSTELGLSGHVTIWNAGLFARDGSVTIVLRGDAGSAAYVRFASDSSPGGGKAGGQFSFRAPDKKDATALEKGSSEEQALLRVLAAACNNTFGTADPAVLQAASLNSQGQVRDSQRAAMAALFLQIEQRNRAKPESKHAAISP